MVFVHQQYFIWKIYIFLFYFLSFSTPHVKLIYFRLFTEYIFVYLLFGPFYFSNINVRFSHEHLLSRGFKSYISA